VDSASQSTILEKNKQIIRDFAEDVFNRHNLAAIDKYMTGGCVGISTKDYGPSACPLRTNSSIVSSSIYAGGHRQLYHMARYSCAGPQMISLQPWSSWEKLATELGNWVTLRSFTAAESAGVHAHPGASVFMNSVVLDWLYPSRSTSRRRMLCTMDFAIGTK
jgi:hypothetical protein